MKSVSKLMAAMTLAVGLPLGIEALAVLNQAQESLQLPSPILPLALGLIGVCTLQQKRIGTQAVAARRR